jgi:hypothetical protein
MAKAKAPKPKTFSLHWAADRALAGGLVEVVSASVPEANQARFVDEVSRSLRRGDLLLLIVGDGIREGVGAITEFIEIHGTLHFTFG